MKLSPALLVLLSCSLVACNPPAPADTVAAPPVTDQPVQDVPPAKAPPITLPPETSAQLARLDGYGDLRLGMSVEEARQAWQGELNAAPSPPDPNGCYYLSPKWVKVPAEFAFMIEGGKFVRYDVGHGNAKEVAPGGGKVGMSSGQIHQLYGSGLNESPHKYVEGGKYLAITASGVAPSKLVFAVDAAGKVTEWRVGLIPQADYVEGCS